MIDTQDRTLLLKRIAGRDLGRFFLSCVLAVVVCGGGLLITVLSHSSLVWAACGSLAIAAAVNSMYRFAVMVRSQRCVFMAHHRLANREWRGY